MHKTLRAFALAATCALVTGAGYSQIATYDALYVFGDSYCDVGNLYIATGGADPAPPYYKGRFSNGPLWVDHVAGFLKVPLTPSLAGGTDFAVGGAWATAPVSIPGGVIPSVTEQVGEYLQLHEGKADPNALYVLEGGGNDILDTTSGSPETLGYEIAVALHESEVALRQAGARHFVIPNLFDVGKLPAAAGNVAFASAASNAANKELDALLHPDEYLSGIVITRIDVFTLLSSLSVDPYHFGFTNITTPCLTTSVCNDPDHTFFWDAHHPTVFGHTIFAVTLENALPGKRP